MRSAFQPIQDIILSKVIGYEALARPSNGRTPLEVIRQAKENGTLDKFDREARETALAEASKLLDREQLLFLNTEPESLQALDDWVPWPYAIRPDNLVFEVTERLVSRASFPALQYLRSIGIRIAIDDFGTGSSNLWLLDQLEPQYVKADRSFLVQKGKALEGLAAMCNAIGITLIVEGVEDLTDLEYLRHIHVRYAQGFFLGRPQYVEVLKR